MNSGLGYLNYSPFASAILDSVQSGTRLIVIMPLVSLSLLIGDILRPFRAIVPANYKVRSLPARVLNFMLRYSRWVCAHKASSVAVLYAYSVSGTN